MPEFDLVAYLDGEADPATARRIAAALAADPRLRQEALALLRQRVALQRVLADMPRVRTVRSRRWWLFATSLAAAAGLAITAFLVWSPAPDGSAAPAPGPVAQPTPPAPVPAQEPAPEGTIMARQADGDAWRAGHLMSAARTLKAELLGGGMIELATGTALAVPDTGGSWHLERGELRCETSGKRDLALSTGQVTVRIAGGELRLGSDREGTLVTVRHGRATVVDRLTRTTTVVEAGSRLWIPADTEAPREAQGAKGRIRGTVAGIERAGAARQLVLHTRFGVCKFAPPWLQRPLGPERAMNERLGLLHPGDRIEIVWHWNEHLRVTEVRMVDAADAEPKPAREQDF